MASSSYYYRQYVQYNKQIKELKNNVNELDKIVKEFTRNPVQGDPGDYNKKMNKALQYHEKGLAGDARFSTLYKLLEEKKEKAVLDDPDLHAAYGSIYTEIGNLEEEISRLQRKADKSWRDYQTAKQQELKNAE